MRKYLIILFCISVLLSKSSIGSAFRYGVSAADVGMAGAMVANYHKGFNAFSNPSFLSKLKEPEFGFSYFRMSLDRSIQSFSYSRFLPPSAGISLSFFRAGVDDILMTDGNNNFIGKSNQWEGYGMMSFGVNIGKTNFGFNLKAFRNEFHTYIANGLGFDFGMNIELNEEYNFGLCIKNIESKYDWDINSQTYDDIIPRFTNLGISYNKNNIKLSFQFDINKDTLTRLKWGTEYNFSNFALLRIGIKENRTDEVNFNYYLGIGIPIRVSDKLNLNLDYSLDPGLLKEGMSHLLSFSLINN